jgi:hypothetical protein
MKINLSDIFQYAAMRHLRGGQGLGENRALLMQACMGYSAYGEKKHAEKYHYVHVLMSGQHYIRVNFAHSARMVSPYEIDRLKWTETACHDSAWRMDGISTPLNDLDRDIRQQLARRTGIEPKDVTCHVWADEGSLAGYSVPITLSEPDRKTGTQKPRLGDGPIAAL